MQTGSIESLQARMERPEVYTLTCLSDLVAAYRLVQREYADAGLTRHGESEMRYGLHQLLPVNGTVAVKAGQRIIATGSIVQYSACGLPSGAIFADVFERLLRRGRRISEGTLLAASQSYADLRACNLAHDVIQLGIGLALERNLDDFCVVVHPKRVKFWTERLGFHVLSGERSCSHVSNLPGIALNYDVRALRDEGICSDQLLERTLRFCSVAPGAARVKRVLSSDEMRVLARLKPDVLEGLDSGARDYLLQYAPHLLEEAEYNAHHAVCHAG